MFAQYKVGPRRVVIAGTFEVAGDNGIIEEMQIADDAVVQHGEDGSDWKAYKESYFDVANLKIDESKNPTWLMIAPLSAKQKHHIEDMTLNNKLRMAFRFGVTGLDGYVICNPDGSDPQPVAPLARKGYSTGMGSAITDGWMAEVNLASYFIQAAGAMVLHISEASAPLSRA
jgi:hypothetical protein